MKRATMSAYGLGLLLLAGCGARAELPVYTEIVTVELETDRGLPFTAESLAEKIHVVDFIFTSCEMACPMMTARMKELYDETAALSDVRFLSVSTDPETDTREVLRSYGEKWGADPERWIFGRAPVEEVVRLSEKEFLLSAQGLPMGHSLRFVLVDAQRRVRGYYDSEDPAQLENLRADLALLTANG